MDTWWRKILYNNLLKALLVVTICVAMFHGLTAFIMVGNMPRANSVYETYQMTRMLIEKAGYVRDSIVRYRTDEIINTITQEDIDKIKESNPELSEEEAKKVIQSDREAYMIQIKNELETKSVNVDFYAETIPGDVVITNMDNYADETDVIEELKSRRFTLTGDGSDIHSLVYTNEQGAMSNLYEGEHGSYYNGKFDGSGYEIYVALKDELQPGDEFYTESKEFDERTQYKNEAQSNLLGGIMVLGLFLPLWIVVVGKRPKTDEINIGAFDRIPLEIQAILLGGAVLGGAGLISMIANFYNFYDISDVTNAIYSGTSSDVYGVLGSVFAIISGLALAIFSSFIKHIKNKSVFYYIGVFRLIGKAKNYILKTVVDTNEGGKLLKFIGVIIAGINFAVMFVVVLSTYAFYWLILIPLFIIFVWSVIVAIFISKIVYDYTTISAGAREISKGNIDTKIVLDKPIPVFNELAGTINTIGDGLDKAIDKSIKSERLKTELITNVSHDLKTPLTSIISYIDLLKSEAIDNKVANEYIEILDERSQRLKVLIEDLVEASKAVTGNIKANKETFSLDELVVQAVGEYTDRIENIGLQVVMNDMSKVYVEGDTRHMWRVADNLLSNVIKYAMPNTRAYIDVKEENGYGVFVIKNISKEALNITPSELTERFVRGEESRTTEGSGLGLAIANSLIDIQKGKLIIYVDGDLFKVEVKLPISILETIVNKESELEVNIQGQTSSNLILSKDK